MSLHYRDNGAESDNFMLFLHGGGVSGWMWEQQLKHFTQYDCAAVDLPGHGLSPLGDAFTIKDSAAQVIQFIEEKAQGKKVIVIGFSLGAQVLIQMLSMKPELIRYAMINSALVRPIRSAQRWIRPSVLMTYPLIRYRWFSRLQAKALYIRDDMLEKYYEDSCSMKPDTLIQVLEENMAFTIPENFGKASCPILVTVGEKEKSMMLESAKDITEANKHCIGVILPAVGHGISLANPKLFHRLVEDWLEGESFPDGYRVIR